LLIVAVFKKKSTVEAPSASGKTLKQKKILLPFFFEMKLPVSIFFRNLVAYNSNTKLHKTKEVHWNDYYRVFI
jgi:hypothetical protein